MIAARIVRSPRAAAAARALSTAVRATAAEGPSTALNAPLSETDPELFDIIEHEKRRQVQSWHCNPGTAEQSHVTAWHRTDRAHIRSQRNSLVLIPSENYTSKSVLDALGSVMSNKYSVSAHASVRPPARRPAMWYRSIGRRGTRTLATMAATSSSTRRRTCAGTSGC